MRFNPSPARSEPSFFELFVPKLWTVLHENYRWTDLRADIMAGLTVAIVALPLSMAIAIASGVSPDRGLYTSIAGGFIVSALGGSRFQIGGPAGAYIVLVWTTVQAYGIEGLIVATILSGLLLTTMGFLKLGGYIKFIPYPVTVGFTAGIAVIIFASQIRDLLGLTLAGPEPGPLLAKIAALKAALPTFNADSLAISLSTIAVIALFRRFWPRWPGMLFAIALAAVLAKAFGLPIETIGSRFGGIPQSLPAPELPYLSAALLLAVFPAAVTFALLGSIESLLSATVADSMTGGRHRSNAELVAQGFANIGSALFGGFCVTGAIARTATNIRAGARGPVAGMAHAVFLALFMVLAAPLAKYIPLAALAGVLAVVCWTMAEKEAFGVLLRASRGDAVVLLATFFLTIFRDLTEGILVGFGLGALLFINRMAESVEIQAGRPIALPDEADADTNAHYDPALAADPAIQVYRISGAFFFGAAANVGAALDEIALRPKALIIDFSQAPVIDSTAAATLEGSIRKAARRGTAVYICGASRAVRRDLMIHGVRPPLVKFRSDIRTALRFARAGLPAVPD
ncbi:SulP family inorganic anion transporter [Methylocapsa palsarum]|uniref:Sulfate permease, SulP family n=1 Tax=Methylocapsa palsarum TaxID=1612308 RepID=A0A1I3Z6L7_9HYPH|nr:SulP family inorganic anion transporter [Methylocapsa palsarum]SFK39610.1 sulfate permease, SulP family [Methylocapsa palsarum]